MDMKLKAKALITNLGSYPFAAFSFYQVLHNYLWHSILGIVAYAMPSLFAPFRNTWLAPIDLAHATVKDTTNDEYLTLNTEKKIANENKLLLTIGSVQSRLGQTLQINNR